MATFKRILVPTDFSPHSKRALRVACELSRVMDAPLMLLHVYAMPAYPLPEGYAMASPETASEVISKLQAALDQLRREAAALGAHGAECLLVEGLAAVDIVRIASEQASDLIVMGTHGRTGVMHALVGSVAEKVVRRAPCAVMAVRDVAPGEAQA